MSLPDFPAVPVSDSVKTFASNKTSQRFGLDATATPSAASSVAPTPKAFTSTGNDVDVNDLTWRYTRKSIFDDDYGPVLHNVNLGVPAGSRCLLIGANGAGKSTLLRIIGGRHMIPKEAVHVLGREAFHDTSLVNQVAIVAERWGVTGDVSVTQLTDHIPPEKQARKERLLEVLDIDPDWKCYRLSDGQRRRVQILVALLQGDPKVLLLDEITTDLDLVGRQNLLRYLKEESEQNGVTMLYATHIFDGLETWPTHICYIKDGVLARMGPVSDFPELQADVGVRSPLFCMVESWLRAEWEEKRKVVKRKRAEPMIGVGDISINTDRTRGENIPLPDIPKEALARVK